MVISLARCTRKSGLILSFNEIFSRALRGTCLSDKDLFLSCATSQLLASSRHYAAVGSKIIPDKEDKSFIDFNAEKLCSHDKFVEKCLSHRFYQNVVTGGEDPKILPDSEYPSWLFELKLERKKELEDLDPEVDGWLYWREYRLRQLRQIHRIEKLKPKFINLQNSPTMWRSGYRGKKTSLYQI